MSGAIPPLFVCVVGVCAATNVTVYSINHVLFVMWCRWGTNGMSARHCSITAFRNACWCLHVSPMLPNMVTLRKTVLWSWYGLVQLSVQMSVCHTHTHTHVCVCVCGVWGIASGLRKQMAICACVRRTVYRSPASSDQFWEACSYLQLKECNDRNVHKYDFACCLIWV
jgi:hypothetical protein